MSNRLEELTIVYKLDTFSVEIALGGIQTMLVDQSLSLSGFDLDGGKPVALSEILNRLKKSKQETFNIIGQGFEFDLSCLGNFQLDFLAVKVAGHERSVWDQWIARFFGNANFVMAWLADVEYEYWQNAHDPLQYTAVGRPFGHLPMKSNGLPFPLEQDIIDISNNPGRRLLKTGYIEVVGAVMWLGESFWHFTKADQSEVMAADWLKVSTPLPTVVRIEATPDCFTTDQGPVGELQHRLRSLLFPELQLNSR